MTASYPGAIKSFGTDFINGDTIPASCVNDLRAEVVAIETAVGINLANAQMSLVTNANDVFGLGPGPSSGWTGTIATLPGGAPTTLTYNLGSGADGSMVVSNTSQLGKQVLFNTTRGTYALIVQNVTGTKTITLTANVPAGWVVGDAITTLSPTIASAGFVEIAIISGELVGKTKAYLIGKITDTTTPGQELRLHPVEAFGASKRISIWCQVVNIYTADNNMPIKLVSNRFGLKWTSSGAATGSVYLSEVGCA